MKERNFKSNGQTRSTGSEMKLIKIRAKYTSMDYEGNKNMLYNN